MKKFIRIILLSSIFPYFLFSQYSEKVFYLRSVSLDAGGNFQSWNVGDTKLSEITFPVQIVVPVSDQMSVSISNVPVLISRTATDTTFTKVGNDVVASTAQTKTTLNSITDTRIGLKYILFNNKGLLNLNVNIPTGKKELEDQNFGLSTELGLGILKYRMPVLGQGFNIGGSFVYAIPLNKKNILGIGISYNMKSKFTPVNSVDYTPGNDYGGSLSYIYSPVTTFKFSLDASYTKFNQDKISFTAINNGQEQTYNMNFQSGYRLGLVAQLTLKTGSFTHWLVLQDKIRGDNTQQTLTVLNNNISYGDVDVPNGQQMETSYNLSTPLSALLTFNAQALYRIYGAGQDNWNGVVIQSDKSSVFGAGVGLRIILLDNLNFDISGKYLTGKVKLGQEYNVSGLDFYAKFNFLF